MFAFFLAIDTERRPGQGHQPSRRNRAATVCTDSIGAGVHPCQGLIDLGDEPLRMIYERAITLCLGERVGVIGLITCHAAAVQQWVSWCDGFVATSQFV